MRAWGRESYVEREQYGNSMAAWANGAMSLGITAVSYGPQIDSITRVIEQIAKPPIRIRDGDPSREAMAVSKDNDVQSALNSDHTRERMPSYTGAVGTCGPAVG
ncbi:hypothetical protein VTK73DRAFT_920 [Phialemonium thermophilum]|uniref:Uncharacterized protein n=1 Tax=Phialemonium thermophilum TaxID=223376 RepID=A0ABR3XCP4_9PEZI